MASFLSLIGAIGVIGAALCFVGAFGLWGDRAQVLAIQVATAGLTLGAASIACLAASQVITLLERIAKNTDRQE